MKTSELMIGDLLYLNRRPVRVDAIGFNGSISYSEKGGFGGIGIDKLSPIPITNEILVKNGFEKQEDSNEWSYYKSKDGKGQYMILWSMDYNYLEIGSYTEEFGEFNRMGIMRYVHQLQHALRLCGIEKELIID